MSSVYGEFLNLILQTYAFFTSILCQNGIYLLTPNPDLTYAFFSIYPLTWINQNLQEFSKLQILIRYSLIMNIEHRIMNIEFYPLLYYLFFLLFPSVFVQSEYLIQRSKSTHVFFAEFIIRNSKFFIRYFQLWI